MTSSHGIRRSQARGHETTSLTGITTCDDERLETGCADRKHERLEVSGSWGCAPRFCARDEAQCARGCRPLRGLVHVRARVAKAALGAYTPSMHACSRTC